MDRTKIKPAEDTKATGSKSEKPSVFGIDPAVSDKKDGDKKE